MHPVSLFKKVTAWALDKFIESSLEDRKKAGALWGVMLTVTLMGTLIFFSEFLAGHHWTAQLPALWMYGGFVGSLVLLRKGRLDGAQLTFLTAFLMVITSIPFLDPYDTPFELYRYSFLVTLVLALSGLFLRHRRHILTFTLVILAGQLIVWYFRLLLPGIVPQDTVLILTLTACLIMTTTIGGVALLSLTIQKQLIDEVQIKEAQAVKQRDSFARFVPKEFLNLLNKDDIQSVELGEGVQRSGTILMADIRDFTGLSETMTPRQVMGFLNEWLEVAAPIFLRHRGIIDKFMGDGLMVIFPHAVEDALEASLELLGALKAFNTARIARAERVIEIGIGINYGELILGTIGNLNRMDGTVVSDAVNLAAHLESLTKFYQSPLLITKEALYETINPNQWKYRFLDTVRLKNRQTPTQVFEVLDALPEAKRELIQKTKDQFEEALESYISGDTAQAAVKFQDLVEINADDVPARIYLDRCQTLLGKAN